MSFNIHFNFTLLYIIDMFIDNIKLIINFQVKDKII